MPPTPLNSVPIHDVVIIGAGASGLSAARHLLEANPSLSVLLLEALPYIGGRVHTTTLTVSSPSLPSNINVRVDLGAEFIHGSTTLINDIVRNSENKHGNGNDNADDNKNSGGWPTEEVFTASQGDGGPDDAPTSDHSKYGVYFLNESKTLLRYDSDDADFVEMNEAFWSLSTLDPADIPPSLSIADHFRQQQISTRMTGMSNAGYSNTSGCSSLHELSLKRTVEYERHWKDHDGCCSDGGGDCRLSPPLAMSDVIHHIAKSADVDVLKHCRTNTTVSKIDYSCTAEDDTIHIQTSSSSPSSSSSSPDGGFGLGLVHTKKVVVTVPVRILIDGDIEFQPPLPFEKIEALDLYGMEDALKLFLVFRTRPWPEKVQNCIIADAPIPEMWFRSIAPAEHEREREREHDPTATTVPPEHDGSSSSSSSSSASSSSAELHICCCFATAEFASSLKALHESGATTVALELLADMFGGTIDGDSNSSKSNSNSNSIDLRQELLHSHMVCWSDVQSVRGGYSFPKVGITKESVETIAAPLPLPLPLVQGSPSSTTCSKVFFAGEATHTGAAMTVHAAMETGIRAAEEVLQSL